MDIAMIMRRIDQLGQDCARALVPIKHFQCEERSVIGSAFLAELEEETWLVTALHTFELYGQSNCGVILWGREFSLADRPLYFSKQDDIAIFPLDRELGAAVSGVFRIPLQRDPGVLAHAATGVVVIGYPVYQELAELPPVVPVSTVMERRALTIGTKIGDPLIYELLPEALVSSDGKSLIANLNPHGMSGGPALAWMVCGSQANPRFEYRLQSVLVEWGSKEGYLVGSGVQGLVDLIDACRAKRAQRWAD